MDKELLKMKIFEAYKKGFLITSAVSKWGFVTTPAGRVGHLNLDHLLKVDEGTMHTSQFVIVSRECSEMIKNSPLLLALS